jgi:hypothetical protein
LTGNIAKSCPSDVRIVISGAFADGFETKKETNPKIPSKKKITPDTSA